jgi:hypothetical protein
VNVEGDLPPGPGAYGPDDEGSGWKPILQFGTDDSRFIAGFTCGRLWETLAHNLDEEIEHALNPTAAAMPDVLELLIRMGEATGRDARTEPLGDDGWLSVFYAPVDRDRAPAWLLA